MERYVAFFRGLNVTGKNIVKMQDLKKILESIGCSNVKTVLASGNAIFTAPQATPKTLQKKIETTLNDVYNYKGNVILRPFDEIRSLAANNPFRNISMTPQTKLYVTFLPIPIEDRSLSELDNFSVVHKTNTEIFSILTAAPDSRSVDAMKILDKAYGPTITTRNWNTILKITSATE